MRFSGDLPRSARWLLCTGAALAANTAWADTPNCADISGGAPILYGAGGSAQRDLVGKAAVILENSSDPVYVVYKDDAGACAGLNALAGLDATTISGTAYYWDPSTGSKTTCNLSFAGDTVQFAVMGVGPLLCPLVTSEADVAGITETTGPISAYSVIVPLASTQQAISAEAFYLVYGFGADAGIEPWTNTDPSYYQHRDENSAAQIVFSAATGLPTTSYYGTDAGSNSATVSNLAALAEPEDGIGFVSADVADANRTSIHELAWKQTGQDVAYWPDSDSASYDKKNVRNGQYFLWNPVHFFGLSGSGGPGTYDDPDVEAFLGYLSGVSQPAGTTTTITETAASNKNVPTCAMHVDREGDLGPEFVYDPPEPCDCYYDYIATGATTCAACDESNPCSSGTCRFGFCEEY